MFGKNYVSSHNLEHELKNCDWIIAKAKSDKSYAQNIYASLCNMEWQKRDIWPILKEETWSCTWRYAGGLVAQLIEEGDYMDWYCSGIGTDNLKYVREGTVTDEIAEDFLKLGWMSIPSDSDDEGY